MLIWCIIGLGWAANCRLLLILSITSLTPWTVWDYKHVYFATRSKYQTKRPIYGACLFLWFFDLVVEKQICLKSPAAYLCLMTTATASHSQRLSSMYLLIFYYYNNHNNLSFYFTTINKYNISYIYLFYLSDASNELWLKLTTTWFVLTRVE